jgi:hypothetical protein
MIIRDEIDIVKIVEAAQKLDFSKPYKVIIEPYDPKSTNAQKRLYWEWIDTIREVTGEMKYDQDELMRKAFLTPIYYTNNKGVDREYIKRISELGKKEMSQYMTDVQIAAAQRGYKLKDPEDLN